MTPPLRRISKSHGLQIAHVKAWRRHTVSMVKGLWNEGVALKEISARLGASETFIDHAIRGNICPDAGPAITPRRSFGINQKRRLRDLLEIPG